MKTLVILLSTVFFLALLTSTVFAAKPQPKTHSQKAVKATGTHNKHHWHHVRTHSGYGNI